MSISFNTNVESPHFQSSWRLCQHTHDCYIFSYNAVENEAQFVLECTPYNPIGDKFPSLFENVMLGCLESFFRFDHQVEITLCLMEATALHHFWESVGLKPSWSTFSPIRLLASTTLKTISFQSMSWLKSYNDKFIIVIMSW